MARAVGAFALGAGLPLAALFAPYLFNPPALAELRFNLVDLNQSYLAGAPVTVRVAALLVGVPPLLLALYRLAPLVVRWRLRGRPAPETELALALALFAGLAVFLGYLPGRAYAYYLVPVVPLLALAAVGYVSIGLQALVARGHARVAGGLAVLLAGAYVLPQLPALAAYVAGSSIDSYLADDRQRFDLDGLVAYVRAHSRPDGAIWVYYNTPELYMLAARRPATRDPVGVWLAALSNETWFQRTAAELAAEQPDLIVGIDQPLYPQPPAQPLLQIPHVGAWITTAYRCDAGAVRGAVVCLRGP
jgi:hypothetical protein